LAVEYRWKDAWAEGVEGWIFENDSADEVRLGMSKGEADHRAERMADNDERFADGLGSEDGVVDIVANEVLAGCSG
jgi:archaellum component FlaC